MMATLQQAGLSDVFSGSTSQSGHHAEVSTDGAARFMTCDAITEPAPLCANQIQNLLNTAEAHLKSGGKGQSPRSAKCRRLFLHRRARE
jgi:hypothetical protein